MTNNPPTLEERAKHLTEALRASTTNAGAQQAADVIEAIRTELVRAHSGQESARRELAEAKQRLAAAENTAHNLQKSLNALWDKPIKLRLDVIALLGRLDDVLPVNNLREHEDIEKMLDVLEDASTR